MQTTTSTNLKPMYVENLPAYLRRQVALIFGPQLFRIGACSSAVAATASAAAAAAAAVAATETSTRQRLYVRVLYFVSSKSRVALPLMGSGRPLFPLASIPPPAPKQQIAAIATERARRSTPSLRDDASFLPGESASTVSRR